MKALDYIRLFSLILALFSCCLPKIGWASNTALSVKISGVHAEEKKIILSRLTLLNAEKKDKNNTEEILNLARLGIEETYTTLKALGYYHAVVDFKYFLKKNKLLVQYTIELGTPISIRSVNLALSGEGKAEKALLTLLEKCPLKIGERLQHSHYELFKNQLLGTALQLGYLNAIYLNNKIQLNPIDNQADIYLQLDTGARYHIGEISFPAAPYPVEYLKQYIPFSMNSPYTTEKLLAFQKSLSDTDLFSKIRIDPELNGSTEKIVPLNVRLTPKPHNKYTASLGFSTDTNMRGSVGWERRRVHYPGHRIHLNAKGSKRLNQINAQYTIPGKRPRTDKLAFGTQLTEEKFSDKKYSMRNESGVTRIQKRGQFEQVLGVHYLSEVFRELPSDLKERSHFLFPTTGLSWSNIEKTSLLQRGIHITVTLKGAIKSLFSTTDLFQAKGQAKWIYALSEDTRLITRSELGILTASHMTQHPIPLSLRFFTGGDHSVRGYGYNSIGPRELDRDGNMVVVGGRYLFVGSIELERRIYKKLGAAIFVDTGNAMNHWRSRLSTGVGCGLRYETALGALRLDVARSTLRGKHKPRVHFTFGVNL
jgi:translocation and assembly module TamA